MSKWHGGKGSAPRPYSVTQEEYDNRWDAIFGRNKAVTEDSSDTDEDNQRSEEENELDDEDADSEDTE